MVRQSGPNEGDDQQGRKFCDTYIQSSANVAGVAGRRCRSQAATCSRDAGSKSWRRPECTCTEIARQCATGIATIDSFAGRDAAAYAWHDSTEPEDAEGIQWRGRWSFEAVACNHRPAARPLPDRGQTWTGGPTLPHPTASFDRESFGAQDDSTRPFNGPALQRFIISTRRAR